MIITGENGTLIHEFFIVFILTAAMLCFYAISAEASTPTLSPPPTPFPFENEIAAFESNDKASFPPEGAIVFIGSSSIRRWTTLQTDMAPADVINRGFGGSWAYQAVHYFDRIVLPYKPSKIFFYEGDNDLANGVTPEDFFADCAEFANLTHNALPNTKLYFLSVKASPGRIHFKPQIQAANAMLKAYADNDPHDFIEYVDVYSPLFDSQGQLIPEYFVSDGVHLSEAGYAVWTSVIRPRVFETVH